MKEKKEVKVTKKQANKKESKAKVITDLDGNVIQKERPKKEKMTNIIKKHISKYKKIYTIVMLAIIGILLVFGIYLGIRNLILYKKYGKYEKEMDNYGFSSIYNNGTAKSSQKVTRIEMIKMVIASVYNITEVESKGFLPQGEYDGDEWASLAKAFEIIDKDYVTKENYDKVATQMEALMIYTKARNKILDIPLSSTKESSFKNLQSYTTEERAYINDAVEQELIKDSKKNIKLNKDMFKGEFNQLVITFVERYNTIAPEGETLVLKEESKPSNADVYPYILYSVDKEVYEYEPIYGDFVDYKTPAETYKYRKDYYSQVEYRAELYYNAILNVDYTTINKDEFYKTVDEFLRHDYDEEINEYVDYVKEHKIKIEGTAKVQFPIFYLDGIRYRARVKLTFKIVNADTDKNLLLGDVRRSDEVTYKNKEYTIFIDAPMGTTYYGRSLLLDMEPIIDLMVNDKEASNLNEF